MTLRTRLVLGALAVTVAALTLTDVLVHRAMRDHLVDRLDRSLREAPLGRGRDGPDDDGPAGDRDGPGDTDGPADPIVFSQGRAADGTVTVNRPARFPDGSTAEPRLPASIAVATPSDDANGFAVFFDAPSVTPGGPTFRVKVSQFTNGTQLVVAAPLTEVRATLATLRSILLGVTAVAVVLAGAVSWALVHVGLRPLRRVERTAAVIAGGRLDERAALSGAPSDVQQLGDSFDAMVDRLTSALEERTRTEGRLRQFVADAAHELRTPVAAVSAYAELIEHGAASRPDDLQRAVRGIRAESGRLGSLVEDLLVLARLEETEPGTGEPVELVAIAAEAVEAARTIAPDWPVRLEAARPVDTTGHAGQLRRVVDNLLANVRAHTPAGTPCVVTVSADETSGRCRIEVTDQGPGLDAAGRASAFDRFWRADRARARAGGGAGLGLAIVAGIADAHGGSASLADAVPTGLSVRVDLPLRPA